MSAGWLAASSGDGTATTSLSCSGSFLRSSAHSSATARDHMLLEQDAASRLAMSLNDLSNRWPTSDLWGARSLHVL